MTDILIETKEIVVSYDAMLESGLFTNLTLPRVHFRKVSYDPEYRSLIFEMEDYVKLVTEEQAEWLNTHIKGKWEKSYEEIQK